MADMGARGPAPLESRVAAAVVARTVSTRVAPLLERSAVFGEVRAVYRRALTIVVAGTAVTIVPETAGGLPDGICVAEPFAPASQGICPGAVVHGVPGLLVLGTQLTIATDRARRWSPALPVYDVAPGSLQQRAAALEDARIALAAAPRWPSGVVTGVPSAAVAELRAVLASGDVGCAIDVGARLIGLGPGLTPAGDDLLVGVGAALRSVGDDRGRQVVAAWAARAIGRTTSVAESYHRHAARGDYAERLHDLLRAVLTGPLAGIPVAAERAADWGATSGLDLLLGVSIGLAAAAPAVRRDRAAA